jgi:AraC family transcriptional regulator of adaptative response/methylated-DNA-[protein]-cysteine methyltransferase
LWRAGFGWVSADCRDSIGCKSQLESAAMTQATLTETDPRWAAVVARNPRFDGKFVYAVRTTGVYCHPTCPSRRAKPQNVAFYATYDDAARAGFRACKRCRPQ